jgi:hypothetical protein
VHADRRSEPAYPQADRARGRGQARGSGARRLRGVGVRAELRGRHYAGAGPAGSKRARQ